MVKSIQTTQPDENNSESLADQMLVEGRFDEARKLYKEIWQRSDQSPLIGGRIFRKIGNCYNQQWRFRDAENAYEKAEQYFSKVADSPEKWSEWIYLQIDFCYVVMHLRKSDLYERKKEAVKSKIELYGNLSQKAYYSYIIFNDILWRSGWFMLPDETIILCEAIIRLADAERNMGIKLTLQNMLAFTYLFRHEYKKARGLAFEILDSIKKEEFGEEMIRAYCTICFSYRKERDIEQAKFWIQKAYLVSDFNKNHTFKYLLFSITAWIYLKEGQLQKAKKYALDSYTGIVQNRYPFLSFSIIPLIAIHLQRDQLHEAIQFAFRLLVPNQQRISESINHQLKVAIMYWGKDDNRNARLFLEQAILMADKTGFL